MASTTLICSFLLFSGTFLVDTSAQILSNSMQNTTTHAPNTTTHAPNTTTHAPNTTAHAPNTTAHAPNTTTHAPNTTTHAPNTTTHAPNTTTHAPNTTTHAPNTTTHAPNTTTHAPFNTTTHIPPTLPPKPSPPQTGNYTVKDGKVCIIADMGLELQIYNSIKEKTDRRYLNIVPKKTNATGKCDESKSNLLLQFPEGSINFIFVKESKTYYIEEVSVQLYVGLSGHWNVTSSNLKLLSTDVGYSVKCKRTPTVKLGNNLELVLANVKLQAFEIKDGTFGKERVCFPDRNKLLIPVGVALAIVGLILIILLVFLLTRRRRISGYERI